MSSSEFEQITQRLQDLRQGQPGAEDKLFEAIYDELRRRAAARMRHERPGHTLQPTALVHETWIRLKEQGRLDSLQDRTALLVASSVAMRRILTDYARSRGRHVADGKDRVRWAEWDEAIAKVEADGWDLLALNDALEQLGKLSKRQREIFELCYFGGLAQKEVAEQIGLSLRSIEREWAAAKAWLRARLAEQGGGSTHGTRPPA